MRARLWRPLLPIVCGLLLTASFQSSAAQQPPRLIPLDGTGRVTYFIADGIERSFYRPGDRQLAVWALQEWQRAAGNIQFDQSDDEGRSLLRLYWVPWRAGELGVTRTVLANRQPAATIFIAPDLREQAVGSATAQAAAADPLLRDAIVYFLCLHEIGHGLGLGHSPDRNDVMRQGGSRQDNLKVFRQYRQRLTGRTSIRTMTWLSDTDKRRVADLYSK